ncbi:prolyl oligopeptidase family serine peptidase [Synechococcus sp. A15-28]|uniref:S9 family peptidase n=1 Tax=Synechococcus sp. A15-28 TaxID=1050638 RepID=UPI0016485935|nr:prolyl oligopeptidase family serine peptidase [Synechococcus sp. A15-28]QNI41427.1 prolyl oligopeptidase/peptidase S9-like domain containing protein [Synechococcus sp. A15-28]
MAPTPLPASIAVGRLPGLKEPQLLEGPNQQIWLLWLEQRPQEKGRTTALIRPFGATEMAPTELTPAPISLRSRVHDYGGGVLCSEVDGETLLLVWIAGGCLWRQDWQLPEQSTDRPKPLMQPLKLTRTGDWDLADGLLDLSRRRWLGIREIDGVDQLVCAELDQTEQEPELLHQPADFAGYACLSPDGAQLAWVEWQQPAMPWESSQLCCADLSSSGDLSHPRTIAGGAGVSVFQPQWLPDGSLLVAEDSDGWWNLKRRRPGAISWEHPWPMAAETAMPQWIYGMSTTAWDGQQLLAATCADGCWSLNRLSLEGTISRIDQPFDDLAGLRALKGRAVAVASNSTSMAGLLELSLASDGTSSWVHTPALESPIAQAEISVAEPIWFDGHDGQRTHAWYYPPRSNTTTPAPLLVKSHSGPTAMARRGLSLAIQYWTSRGWGVVDVNYGGSTGFGREYRERLNGSWGVVDVADCAAAARAMIASGRAHPEQIAIEGGSAGGFTTLAALCFTDVFRVGACRYAVCDLTAMAQDTHCFEARYLDSLVGDWPEQREIFEQRSPLLHADCIRCPVLFFQGLQDKVVPPEQTERMAEALRSNGIPVEVRLFEEEGHGFRNQATQIEVLEETERFFCSSLRLDQGPDQTKMS